MNRYILIRRLRGPLFLLLLGVIALLNQADILEWQKSWPLFFILLGVLKLAERAAFAIDGEMPPFPLPYAGQPAGQPVYPAGYQPVNTTYASQTVQPAPAQSEPAADATGNALVPSQPQGIVLHGEVQPREGDER